MIGAVQTKNIKGVEDYFKRKPEIAAQSLVLAINDSARKARTLAIDEIRSQVNLTRRYVEDRLNVSQFANANRLEAVVQGRQRATSLNRFDAKPLGRKGSRGGVRVRVKAGGAGVNMKRAFLIKLAQGRSTADGSNTGVAIRLKQGESFENKKSYSKSDPGLYLLYGPSVQQVFTSVRGDIEPDVSDFLESEFTRQFKRLSEDA